MSPARVLGVTALALYAVYAFASGAPGFAIVALAAAVLFGAVGITAPKPVEKEISVSATILMCAGATLLFGLLVRPLGPWALVAFLIPVVAVAYWQFDLKARQALLLGVAFVLALVAALVLLFLAV